MSEWTALVEDVLHRSKPAAMWFIEYMASSEGRTYIKSVTSRSAAAPPPHSPDQAPLANNVDPNNCFISRFQRVKRII